MHDNEHIDELINQVHSDGEAYFTVTSLDGSSKFNAIHSASKREGFDIKEVDYDVFGGIETYRISKFANEVEGD